MVDTSFDEYFGQKIGRSYAKASMTGI